MNKPTQLQPSRFIFQTGFAAGVKRFGYNNINNNNNKKKKNYKVAFFLWDMNFNIKIML